MGDAKRQLSDRALTLLSSADRASRRNANRLTVAAAAILLVMLSAVVLDQMYGVSGEFDSTLVGRAAQALGLTASGLAWSAGFLNASRRIAVSALAQGRLPRAWCDAIQPLPSLLRNIHPGVGLAAAGVAVAHGYMMIRLWGSAPPDRALLAGLGAFAALAALSVSGYLAGRGPKKQQWTSCHRLLVLVFVTLFVSHRFFRLLERVL